MLMRVLLLVSLGLAAVLGAAVQPEAEKDKGEIWAVLVAGSNTWGNYRHQADVCHAYQIFRRHGVPDSNIIVMMYDDIANDDDNPHKGVIINKPGGPNVYKNVPKDYTKSAVTPENFVHILTGNKEALKGQGSGKVLKSGPNDHVFVNFVDHGAAGLIGFPTDVMYAHQLLKALKTMHENKMYKKLVFYMEACESGSMFKGLLPKNIEIFATTAANPDESSYACYYDDALQNYLGDEYSVAWMEDIDSGDHNKKFDTETLLKQFNRVVKRVTDSHPQKYGQMAIDKDHVEDFIGGGEGANLTRRSEKTSHEANFQDAVSSRDVALRILERKIQLTNNVEDNQQLQKKLETLIAGRKMIDDLFARILASLDLSNLEEVENSHLPLNLEMMACYKTLVDTFSHDCVDIIKNTYAMSHLYKLANLCVLEHSTEDVLRAFSEECDGQLRSLVGVN